MMNRGAPTTGMRNLFFKLSGKAISFSSKIDVSVNVISVSRLHGTAIRKIKRDSPEEPSESVSGINAKPSGQRSQSTAVMQTSLMRLRMILSLQIQFSV
ncbi:hypothetical protein [Ochrobactrum sp. RH2CCR150]|uniref:hypothetical protein n=1 Tax=Ochrobactrum sp. RH2CCR150 TaxID=2587044 RepID=UPI0015F856D8|nr:hypothetical protein [Ochrobactrum sp. RH2CCR150]